jgi:hypothetical protein
MRNFVLAVGGLALGAAIVTAVAVAVPQQAPVSSGMPMGSMGNGTMAMGTASSNTALTIRHVLRGCHVWSKGKTTSATMRLNVKRGQRLTIDNLDFDAHQLVQFSGPAHLRLGKPIMMNHQFTISFAKAGSYRLGTKTVDMPGVMEVKTIGADNKLRLTVAVK